MTITPNSLKLLQEYRTYRPKPIQDKTFNNYIYVFETIEKEIKADLSNIEIQKLIKLLRKADITTAIKLKFISLMKIIRNTDDFDKYIEELTTQLKEQSKTNTKKQMNNNNVDYNQLKELLKTLEGEDYILLYILLNYGVRNKDLVIEITDDPNLINGVLQGNINKNILYFQSKGKIPLKPNMSQGGETPYKLYYARNDYKTDTRYGVIKINITDKKFMSIVRTLNINDFVFIKRTNKPYDESEMSNLLKRTFNKYIKNSNLTEGLIYKIQVEHLNKTENHKRLKQLSQTRPHTLAVQYSNYE